MLDADFFPRIFSQSAYLQFIELTHDDFMRACERVRKLNEKKKKIIKQKMLLMRFSCIFMRKKTIVQLKIII